MPVDDPDIESAMEDIAAAIVRSATASVRELEEVKAELVAAVRAELQNVVETSEGVTKKAAVAEALKDVPAPKPATRARRRRRESGEEEGLDNKVEDD